MWFFKPAWMSKNVDKAENAVKKVTDLDLLLHIASNSEVLPSAQAMAEEKVIAEIQKIADQKALFNIAMTKGVPLNIRFKATEMISDQALLTAIACAYTDISSGAVRKLTDQNLLADIAKDIQAGHLRIDAFKVLSDQSILEEIARNDADAHIRDEAMFRLPSPIMKKIQEELCNKGLHYFTIPWISGDSTITPTHNLFYCKYCHAGNGKKQR
jgi:hypothetical protein